MINRRKFLKTAAAAAGTAFAASSLGVLSSCRKHTAVNSRFANKVIVLGMDGMDPALVRRFVAEGRMPNFARLMEKGHFGPLATTMPPQSPVAWASFITGTGPGGHGIYDFIHRDPISFSPFLSTSRSYDAGSSLPLGSWKLPLKSGRVELERKGTAFWTVLEEAGIPATVYRIPANYPVVPSATKMISGMGTPDLLGTYGTFTFFTEQPGKVPADMPGGRVVPLRLKDNQATAVLEGPANPLRSDSSESKAEISFRRDPLNAAVVVEIQGQQLLLQQGEWSDWVPVRFDYLPHLMSSGGMFRLMVKQVHPQLEVYCSPINIDPMDAAVPIESPSGHAAELAQHIGRFYTQGFPCDTKALSSLVLSDDEYLAQSRLVLEDSLKAFDYGLSRFDEGFFFFYFSSTDQDSHMLLRALEREHPQYDERMSPGVKNAIADLYSEMDKVLAQTLSKIDSQTLLFVISDHGFGPFYREVHLNNWLVEKGYMVLTHPKKMKESRFFDYVDWSKTQAYALGINGLYLNLAGRERKGMLRAGEAEALKQQLQKDLQQLKDPKNGKQAVLAAYDSSRLYQGPFRELAPDIVVGYASGYRSSDQAAFGKFGDSIIGDRTDKWASDHCIDHSAVPGIVLMNRECRNPQPGIWDMASTILTAFGQELPQGMGGRSLV